MIHIVTGDKLYLTTLQHIFTITREPALLCSVSQSYSMLLILKAFLKAHCRSTFAGVNSFKI